MIPYSRQTICDEDINSVSQILQSDFLTTGPSIQQFEQALCEYTGAKFAVACCNGTAALHLACLAINLLPGEIGLTSPISFVASANCIEMCGAKAGFIDIDERYCLDPNLLEDYCKKNKAPKVVIPVDLAGIPAKMSEINYLSQKYGFYVIEDASHSIGTSYSSKNDIVKVGSGTDAHLTTFSFHPVKNITTGEGGAVLTNDESLAEKLRSFRGHGIERDINKMEKVEGGWWYEMNVLGYNYRLTDFQAAIGISQLKKIEKFKAHKLSLVERYNQELSNIPGLYIPPQIEDASVCYHLYPILINQGQKARKFIYDFLKEKNIHCQVHYIPIHFHPYYRAKYNYNTGDFKNAEKYYDQCLSIPLYNSLSYDEQDYVISSLRLAINEFK